MSSDNLREIREALGLPQSKVAKLLGVHVLTISRWECGTMKPHGLYRELITQLARASKKKGAGERIAKALDERGVAGGLREMLETGK